MADPSLTHVVARNIVISILLMSSDDDDAHLCDDDDRLEKLLNLSRKNPIALKQKNFNDEINNFSMNSYYSKIWNYVKLIISLHEMEELKKFQSSTFDTIARRILVEDQDTILDLIGNIQELQNEINCMNDSRDFQDAESVRSEPFHRNAEPQRRAAKHLGHTWFIGKRFLQIQLRPLQRLVRRN